MYKHGGKAHKNDIFREIDNESGDFSIINRYGVVLFKEPLLFFNTTYQ